MKQALIVAAISAIALVSCSKEEQKIQGNYDESVTSFQELNVPEGFDFSELKTVTLKVPAHEGLPSQAMTLITIQNKDEVTLLKYNVDLSKGLEMPFDIVDGTKELFLVNASGTRKALSVSGNVVTLNSI
ncbi:hypothetical protein Oweho_1465 [Owenweeksia hongkongensis DSM 17368]|uniref:Lipoprotein n=1 Tax=Owenweeksia hongkongensis (strain DSM 17368 / CIP 108786 / JCM 12287 / NRRL B-23963 / UST20020801) TaxID=926562 RepID=G8R893_OWEHD|nr:hypothetical protein [Owenweeksia hongkongensis]AEV32461.1 hypothetical protein Oweho_1465 [Owenweeksia hongkongensis DSM 17368]